MGQSKDRAQSIALIVVIVGIITYIAADLGLGNLKNLLPTFASRPSEAPVRRDTSAIKLDLQELQKSVSTKADELEELNSKLSSLNLEITTRLSDLKKISRLEGAKGRSVITRSTASDNQLADHQFATFQTTADIIEAAKSWNIGEYLLELVTEDGAELQRFSHQNPFAENSLYLKPAGIRWAQLVSKSARDLGSQRIAVRFDETDGFESDRAEVLKNYLAKLVGEKITVDLQDNKSSVKSGSGIDVFFDLQKKGGNP